MIESIPTDQLDSYFSAASLLEDRQIILEKLEAGELEIYKVGGCAFISCFSHLQNGDKILSVFCTEGKNYIKSCLRLVEIAKSFGCKGVEFNTHRKGVVRWAVNNGAVIVSRETDKIYLFMEC